MHALSNPLMILILVLVWSIPWKGLALWKAARRDQPLWFIALFLVNTAGILEMLYIFIFAPRQPDLVSEGGDAGL